MTRRRQPPSKSESEMLRGIIESPEYREALTSRMMAGKASSAEIALARDLGMVVPSKDPVYDAEQAVLREMDQPTQSRVGDLLRMLGNRETASRLRVIDAGAITGIGWTTTTAVMSAKSKIMPPTTDGPETDDLLPPKRPA